MWKGLEKKTSLIGQGGGIVVENPHTGGPHLKDTVNLHV